MRAQIAAAAAFAGAAVAVPAQYQAPPAYTTTPEYEAPSPTPVYGYPSSTPVYESTPVYSPPVEYSSTPVYGYPSSTPVYESSPVYSTPAEYPTPTPYYTPAPSDTVTYVGCSTDEVTVTDAYSTTVYTSVIPYTTTVCPYSEVTTLESYWVPYTEVYYTPVVYSTPVEATTPCTTETPVTYTATHPTATGGVYTPVAPYPSGSHGTGVVYPTGTGVPTQPSSYPPQFTGAASNVKALGGLAGLGAIAALFL